MANERYKKFAVISVASTEVLDSGLESTQTEPKTVVGVGLCVTDFAGNTIVGYVDQTKVLEIPDYMVHSYAAEATDTPPKSYANVQYYDLNIPLLQGQTFRVGISCGATNENLTGYYKYEITAGT